VPSILRHGARGSALQDKPALRRNLSYVLHEHERSDAVSRVVADCLRHQRQLRSLMQRELPVVSLEPALPAGVLDWISAGVGLPERLQAVLERHSGAAVRVTLVDGLEPDTEALLFRGLAQLVLPDATPRRIGVAALVLRPGGGSAQLNVTGAFDWPDEVGQALEAVERLIQPFASQWLPRRTLWQARVEEALPGEIR
jgi:hypothetical protein